jgi:hypothetical protein
MPASFSIWSAWTALLYTPLAPYEIVDILITVYAYLNAVHLIEEAYEPGYEYAIGAHPDR